jgi:hypothetical protein
MPRIIPLYVILAFFYLQVFCSIPDSRYSLLASDQPTTCADRLDEAEEFYYDGEFDRTINIVNQCLLQESLPKEEQVRSYTILARTYLAKEDTIKTKDNIQIILKLEPSYQPTIEQETPKYVNFVAEVIKEQDELAAAEVGTGISSWLLIGAGSAAAVAIIAIVASGSSDENGTQETSLPKPPDFPE